MNRSGQGGYGPTGLKAQTAALSSTPTSFSSGDYGRKLIKTVISRKLWRKKGENVSNRKEGGEFARL